MTDLNAQHRPTPSNEPTQTEAQVTPATVQLSNTVQPSNATLSNVQPPFRGVDSLDDGPGGTVTKGSRMSVPTPEEITTAAKERIEADARARRKRLAIMRGRRREFERRRKYAKDKINAEKLTRDDGRASLPLLCGLISLGAVGLLIDAVLRVAGVSG